MVWQREKCRRPAQGLLVVDDLEPDPERLGHLVAESQVGEGGRLQTVDHRRVTPVVVSKRQVDGPARAGRLRHGPVDPGVLGRKAEGLRRPAVERDMRQRRIKQSFLQGWVVHVSLRPFLSAMWTTYVGFAIGPPPAVNATRTRKVVTPTMQVSVRDNNVDQALRALKKKLQREGVFREMKLRQHFAENAFALQLFLQGTKRLIDIV